MLMNFWKMRGKDLQEIDFSIKSTRHKKDIEYFCNDIFCFDIETSNGFLNKNTGIVEEFSHETYNKNPKYYNDFEKISLPYLWGFSINDNVYVGRELRYVLNLMDEIEKKVPELKFVYVHNLPFEFMHLLNILKPQDVFAREKRKVITFSYKSWKFRCSLKLVNLSLDSWANNKNLPVKKLKENMSYLELRTPNTDLPKEIYDYQINDVLVMYYGLLEYRERYKDVYHIPLTQTGETRMECRKIMRKENVYRNKCISLIPKTLEELNKLTDLFAGGYTHANQLYSCKILKNVKSKDLASSYPTVMFLEKYPFSRFEKTKPLEKYLDNDRYSYIIRIRADYIESKFWNSFLSSSKVNSMKKCKYDNGRIISAYDVDVTLTNIDYHIFKKCYEVKNEQILNFEVSVNRYLNDSLVKYILQLYRNKTEFKNIPEKEDYYMHLKQLINGMFGMAVTKDITDDIIFNDLNEWKPILLNSKRFDEKIAKMKKAPSKIFTTYQSGVWVTAYARRNLWTAITALDDDVVYCDTDSVKYIGEHEDFFKNYNANILKRIEERANNLGLTIDDYSPADKFGERHTIGFFDTEKPYERFITLGAKKYLVEQEELDETSKTYKKKLKLTLSGVKKSAVSSIKKMEDFKDGLTFDSKTSGRLISYYNENQTPVTWKKGEYDEYYSDFQYGICLMPSSYTLGVTPEYLELVLENSRPVTEIFK